MSQSHQAKTSVAPAGGSTNVVKSTLGQARRSSTIANGSELSQLKEDSQRCLAELFQALSAVSQLASICKQQDEKLILNGPSSLTSVDDEVIHTADILLTYAKNSSVKMRDSDAKTGLPTCEKPNGLAHLPGQGNTFGVNTSASSGTANQPDVQGNGLGRSSGVSTSERNTQICSNSSADAEIHDDGIWNREFLYDAARGKQWRATRGVSRLADFEQARKQKEFAEKARAHCQTVAAKTNACASLFMPGLQLRKGVQKASRSNFCKVSQGNSSAATKVSSLGSKSMRVSRPIDAEHIHTLGKLLSRPGALTQGTSASNSGARTQPISLANSLHGTMPFPTFRQQTDRCVNTTNSMKNLPERSNQTDGANQCSEKPIPSQTGENRRADETQKNTPQNLSDITNQVLVEDVDAWLTQGSWSSPLPLSV